MSTILKKSLYVGLATLMVGSIGSGSLIITSGNTSIHASYVNRLVTERNRDSKKAKYYNRQVKRLNSEIAQLNHHHYSKAFRQGYNDGLNDVGMKVANAFTVRLMNNKQYKRGFIDAEMHGNKLVRQSYREALKSFKSWVHDVHRYGNHSFSVSNKDVKTILKDNPNTSYLK